LPAQTYTGGGTSSNWSDSANWDPAVVPAPGPTRAITIDPPREPRGPLTLVNQDVADPFALNQFAFNARGRNVTLDGGRIVFAGDNPFLHSIAAVTDSRVIRQTVEINGPLSVHGERPFGLVYGGLTLKEVVGTGSVTLSDGVLRYGRASYTGTTTVRGGILEIGGWTYGGPFGEFMEGATQGQGDYFIGPTSDVLLTPTLSGVGTIGLAPGRRVTVQGGGSINPGHSALGDVAARLTIHGGLRIGDEGHYQVWAQNAPMATPELVKFSDVVDVNGLLDLSSAVDRLDFNG
jgi:hypothetical protein